jgi:hypothetical protein
MYNFLSHKVYIYMYIHTHIYVYTYRYPGLNDNIKCNTFYEKKTELKFVIFFKVWQISQCYFSAWTRSSFLSIV